MTDAATIPAPDPGDWDDVTPLGACEHCGAANVTVRRVTLEYDEMVDGAGSVVTEELLMCTECRP